MKDTSIINDPGMRDTLIYEVDPITGAAIPEPVTGIWRYIGYITEASQTIHEHYTLLHPFVQYLLFGFIIGLIATRPKKEHGYKEPMDSSTRVLVIIGSTAFFIIGVAVLVARLVLFNVHGMWVNHKNNEYYNNKG